MKLLQEIEQHSQEIRRLLNVPDHTAITLTLTAFREALNADFSLLNAMISGFPMLPLGAIIPWHKGWPAPPIALDHTDQWAECNGQVLDDPRSVFHGLTLPNLNGQNRFLRGNATSGGIGGAATHSHNIGGNTGAPDSTILVDAATPDTPVPSGDHTHNMEAITDPESSLPPYFNVVWIIRIK